MRACRSPQLCVDRQRRMRHLHQVDNGVTQDWRAGVIS
jgi:hypothetical protein